MIAYFNESELRAIKVKGNSQTIYFVRDDETKDLIGINKAVSTDMLILMENKEMQTITYQQEPRAVLYPEKDLKN